MHTVQLLERAIDRLRQLGYGVRQEYLGGTGGGSCEVKGQKWLFLDLALSPDEQLEVVVNVLRQELAISYLPSPAENSETSQLRKSA